MFEKTRAAAEKTLTLMAKDVKTIMDTKFKEGVDYFYDSPNPYNRRRRQPKQYRRGFNFYRLSGPKGAMIHNTSNQSQWGRRITLEFDTDYMGEPYRSWAKGHPHFPTEAVFEMDFLEGLHGGRMLFGRSFDENWSVVAKFSDNKWQDSPAAYWRMMDSYGSLPRALGKETLEKLYDKHAGELERIFEQEVDEMLFGKGGR